MSVLQIQAGRRALRHIHEHGLAPGDVKAVFGASGAAKWLGICGLDSVIFADWLSQSQQPVALLGTSVGAMKLAAAVQPDCRTRLAAFAARYIEQQFDGRPTADAVERETDAVIDAALGDNGEVNLLQHPRYQFHCGAVHVSGPLAASGQRTQVAGMVSLAGSALRGRKQLLQRLTRVIFRAPAGAGKAGAGDPSVEFPITSQETIDTLHLELNEENLRTALRASGAIPVYLNSVELQEPAAPGAGEHNYHGRCSDGKLTLRDGGLLDYHPIPKNLSDNRDGLVLYPHFYPRLTKSWFDKFYPWRKVPASQLENVILVSPSAEFVRSLPGGRIPDRRDFIKYQDRNEVRMQRWREATDRSEELGEAWMQIAQQGNWDEVVKPIR